MFILAWLATTAWRLRSGDLVPSPRVGRITLCVGGLYFTFMLMRLLLGATVLRQHPWFDKPLPTFFHLVLATYLLVYGHFHRHGGASPSLGIQGAPERVNTEGEASR